MAYDVCMDTYRIVVKELPSPHLTDLYTGLTIAPLENGEVEVIVPIVDQSALRGLLDNLWDFNATIVAVERIENR